MGVLAIARPLLYVTNRVFATRLLHTVLRGVSRDRLDLLGEEYFEYALKPRLKQQGVDKLKEAIAAGADIVLVSQGLDHIMRPLANYLGVERILSIGWISATASPRGGCSIRSFARAAFSQGFAPSQPDGRISRAQLLRDLGFEKQSGCDRQSGATGEAAVSPARTCRSPDSIRGTKRAASPFAKRCAENIFF